ncbi:Short-chain dehydrogenase/reductase SDR - like 10 [Theobroma cacao]|nr:Short-chain dehydrogenase/reductase SDR - like 10 [Theobroma cacao]
MFLILKFLNFLKRTINIENLSGKVVLITGASSGIGEVLLWAMKHLAHEYANRGARLALAARREHRPRAVAEKASQLGSPDAIVVQMNSVLAESTDECAKAIVNSACRGDKYLTAPSWYVVGFLFKLFYPEVLEWCFHWHFISRRNEGH